MSQTFARCMKRIVIPNLISSSKRNISSSKSMQYLRNLDVKSALRNVVEDKGRIIMNVGAIASLSGFMMSDVLHLRMLSIFGSCCGITYNFTRNPRQINGVAWGLFFVGTNVYMIYQLLQERQEIKFTKKEMELYSNHFRAFGVAPTTFFELMALGDWRQILPGGIVVNKGQKFEEVILVHKGRADVHCASDSSILYSYFAQTTEDGSMLENCVIGGTALVDPSVLETKGGYPNMVLAQNDCEVIAWPTKRLMTFMDTHPAIKVAMLHTLHENLVRILRKHGGGDEYTVPGLVFSNEKKYKLMMRAVLVDGVLTPFERKMVVEYKDYFQIDEKWHQECLEDFEWTKEDWRRGHKIDKVNDAHSLGNEYPEVLNTSEDDTVAIDEIADQHLHDSASISLETPAYCDNLQQGVPLQNSIR